MGVGAFSPLAIQSKTRRGREDESPRSLPKSQQPEVSALGQLGSYAKGLDGFSRILTGFYLLGPARVWLVPSGPPKHMISRDFDRILTGF